jgi:hypothetical protein
LADIDRHHPTALPRPLRLQCMAGKLVQPVGQGLLKVPFARCYDGLARHVSTVLSVQQGPFHCLDCGEVLTLRNPINKRRHFAHRPDSVCTGETALHRYAKELLVTAKTLTLPALVLTEGRVRQPVFAAGTYSFEAVLPEHKIGTFQPDALVRYLDFDLAVEFLVHHAVDDEKRAKVSAHDISMVEIDLSGLKAGQMNGTELDDAILHSSPRQWIHHRKCAAAMRKLSAAVAKAQLDRGARLKGHILRKRSATAPEGWRDEAMKAVRRTGLEALIDLEVEGGHWFAVPDKVWQAEALFEHVIKPSEQYSPGGKKLEIKGAYPTYHDLSSKLPDWMVRQDLGDYPPKSLAEAGFDKKSYGSPHGAVWNYLAVLTTGNGTVLWSREDAYFYIQPRLQDLLQRRVDLPERVKLLLVAGGVKDTEAGYRRWGTTYRSGNLSPFQLVEAGGDGYHDLIARIAQLEAMVSGSVLSVVDDLCGLPLEPIRVRNQAAMAVIETKRKIALDNAASERQRSIRVQAEQMLAADAKAWLGQQIAGTKINHLEYAREGDAALFELELKLGREGDERRKQIAAKRHVAHLRDQLKEAAKRAFPSERMAELFLNSGHPRLQGGRPIDRCGNRQDLAYITSLMTKKR